MRSRILSMVLALLLVAAMLPSTVLETYAATQQKTSEKAIGCIKNSEGFHPNAYVSGSSWYIGYGTSARPGDTITEAEADEELRDHLERVEEVINKFAAQNGLRLTQNEFDALASFSYNLGTAWMYQNGRFRSAVVGKAGEAEFLFAISLWANDGSVPSEGLLKRRMAEADMFLNGAYEKRSDRYTYTIFNPNGGVPGTSGEDKMQGYHKNGSTEILVQDPTYKGRAFEGWYTQPTGGSRVTTLSSATAGKTLYAHYSSGGTQEEPEEDGFYGSDGSTRVLCGGRVMCSSYVNVRKGPGTNYPTVDREPSGAKVNIYQTAAVGAYKWARTDKGWIRMDYIREDSADSDSTSQRVTGRVNTNGLNVRFGPGTSYAKVDSLPYGVEVTVYEEARGGNYSWGRIGTDRWVCMDYISLNGQSGGTDPAPGTAAMVTGAALVNVRSGPGTGYPRVSTLPREAKVNIYETKTASDGVLWARIGPEKWMSTDYLTKVEDGGQDSGTGVVISKTSLNVRSGPGTQYSCEAKLLPGTRIEILEQTKVNGVRWGKTSRGWVCMTYVDMS